MSLQLSRYVWNPKRQNEKSWELKPEDISKGRGIGVASIQTAIQLNDQFSGVLNNIINSVNLTLAAMQDMRQSMSATIDTSSIDGAREHINQATAALIEMNEAASQQTAPSAEGYERIANAAEDAGQAIRDNITSQELFNSTVQAGSNHAKSFVRTLAGLAVVRAVINVVTSQIGSAISRMDTMTNYNKTMTAITGSADMATASLDRLKEITKGTAYGLDTAAKATQNFVTRGMKIGTATAEVGKWADAVAFYGDGTNESLMTVTDALGKMLSKGTVEMEQLNRLTDNGINAVGIYAEATGQSTASVQDDLSNGVISAQDFITTVSTAFTEGTNGVMNIAGAAKEAGGTWATSIANAKAAIARGLISVINGINQGLANAGFGTLLDGITAFGVQAEIVLNNIGNSISQIITMLSPILNLIADIVGFITDSWSVISPIIYGVIAALVVYGARLAFLKGLELAQIAVAGIMAVAKGIQALAIHATTSATWAETQAQLGLNGAMYACPIVWIIGLIVALIAVVLAICNYIAQTTDVAESGLGIICGALAVAVAFIGNMVIALINMTIDIFAILWNFIAAFANFFGNVFNDPVGAIVHLFFDMADCVLSILETLASAMDTLFGSNLAGAVSGWRSSLDGWVDDTFGEQKEIMQKMNGADSHISRLKYSEVFQAGVNFGDDKWSNLKEKFSQNEIDKKTEIELPEGFSGNSTSAAADGGAAGGNAAKTAANTADTADNTAAIAKSLDITNEELKYLRDIAERDTVNRFTTASIKVEMTNHNRIDSKQDLDGIVSTLTSKIENAMLMSAEGVHV